MCLPPYSAFTGQQHLCPLMCEACPSFLSFLLNGECMIRHFSLSLGHTLSSVNQIPALDDSNNIPLPCQLQSSWEIQITLPKNTEVTVNSLLPLLPTLKTAFPFDVSLNAISSLCTSVSFHLKTLLYPSLISLLRLALLHWENRTRENFLSFGVSQAQVPDYYKENFLLLEKQQLPPLRRGVLTHLTCLVLPIVPSPTPSNSPSLLDLCY